MNDNWLFVIGLLIFGGYMYGLLSMINKQHRIQAREQSKYEENLRKKSAQEAAAGVK